MPGGDTDDLQVAAGTPGRPPEGPHRMRERGDKRRSRGTFSRPDQELPASRGDHGENGHEDDRVPFVPRCPDVTVSHQQGQCPAGQPSGEPADQHADPRAPPHSEKAARQPGQKQCREQAPREEHRRGERVDSPSAERGRRQAGSTGPPGQSLIHLLTSRSRSRRRGFTTHSRNVSSISGSRPLVGSSRISRSARQLSAAMSSTFCRLPFEYARTRLDGSS